MQILALRPLLVWGSLQVRLIITLLVNMHVSAFTVDLSDQSHCQLLTLEVLYHVKPMHYKKSAIGHACSVVGVCFALRESDTPIACGWHTKAGCCTVAQATVGKCVYVFGGMTAFGFAHDVYLWLAGLHTQQGRLLPPLLQCSQCAGTGGLAPADMDQLAASGMFAATARNLSTA